MENERARIQWHPAFYAATQLDFDVDADNLEFIEEKQLSKAPLAVDVVIVKKKKDIETKNYIGKIFREHNIIEYKAIKDDLNVDTYHKVIAYACLYKASAKRVDEIKQSSISITMTRYIKPVELFSWFSNNGYSVNRIFPGIYYVNGGMFPCQIVVIKELEKEDHLWLRTLTDTIEEDVISAVEVEAANEIRSYHRQLMKSVLYASINANREQFRTEEEKEMDAIKELFGYDFAEVNEKLEKAQKESEKNRRAREKAQKAQEKAQRAQEKAEKENEKLRNENEMLRKQLAAMS